MVVNMFKMRSDIRSINIAGMGCSASVIAIDVAKDMLAVRTSSSFYPFFPQSSAASFAPLFAPFSKMAMSFTSLTFHLSFISFT